MIRQSFNGHFSLLKTTEVQNTHISMYNQNMLHLHTKRVLAVMNLQHASVKQAEIAKMGDGVC